MNADMDLDRRLERWFAEEAPSRSPDRVLEAAMDRVAVLPQRRSIADRLGQSWGGWTVRRRLLLVALTMVVLAGAAAVGAFLLRSQDPGQEPPELVLLRRQAPGAAAGMPVDVIAIDGAGKEREIASLTEAQLGAQYTEWYAGLSANGYLVVPVTLPGGASGSAVVDLRSPDASARRPDAEGAFPAIAPDGRLAMARNAGGYSIFDPAANTTEILAVVGDVRVLELGFGPVWESTGRGLMADSGGLGFVGLDGAFVAGDGRGYYGGIGPRRVDAQGRWLRCTSGDDATCGQPDTTLVADGGPAGESGAPVWSETIPGQIVGDWAWAADGGVWALMESDGDGPRTVTILKVAPDDRATALATFPGVADDPDPNSYFPAGVFAGFAPDDHRVVISLLGDGGAPGQLWSFDPLTGTTTRLPDGIIAGWLTPSTLTTPRAAVEPLIETDAAIRGDWSNGRTTMHIGQTTLSILDDATDPTSGPRMRLNASGADTMEINGGTDLCAPDQVGVYRWSADAASLTLTPSSGECLARATLLGSTFERVLPYPDTGSVPVAAGSRLLVPDAAVPFRLTLPPAVAPAVVERHVPGLVALSSSTDEAAVRVTILLPQGGALEPCSRSDRSRPLARGVDGVVAYLDTVATPVTVTDTEPVDVGGTAARTFTIGADASCRGPSLFAIPGDSRPVFTGTGRLSVLEPVPGQAVVIVLSGSDSSTEALAWADELLASIDFVGASP